MQGIYLMLMRFIYSEEICGELRCHYRNLLQLLAAGFGPTRSISYRKIASAIGGQAAVPRRRAHGQVWP